MIRSVVLTALLLFGATQAFPAWAISQELLDKIARERNGASAERASPKKTTQTRPAAKHKAVDSRPAEPAEDPLVRAERDMLSLQAQKKYAAGDKAGALATWQTLEKKGRPSADLYYLLGKTSLELKHPDEAERYLKRYVTMTNGSGSRYNDVLELLGQLDTVRQQVAAEQAQQEEARRRQEKIDGAWQRVKTVWRKLPAVSDGCDEASDRIKRRYKGAKDLSCECSDSTYWEGYDEEATKCTVRWAGNTLLSERSWQGDEVRFSREKINVKVPGSESYVLTTFEEMSSRSD